MFGLCIAMIDRPLPSAPFAAFEVCPPWIDVLSPSACVPRDGFWCSRNLGGTGGGPPNPTRRFDHHLKKIQKSQKEPAKNQTCFKGPILVLLLWRITVQIPWNAAGWSSRQPWHMSWGRRWDGTSRFWGVHGVHVWFLVTFR